MFQAQSGDLPTGVGLTVLCHWLTLAPTDAHDGGGR